MNQLCAYCQSPLAPGERQCQRCGRWQSLSNTAYHPSEDPADDAWEDTNSTWANPSGPTQQGRLSRGQPLGSPRRQPVNPSFAYSGQPPRRRSAALKILVAVLAVALVGGTVAVVLAQGGNASPGKPVAVAGQTATAAPDSPTATTGPQTPTTTPTPGGHTPTPGSSSNGDLCTSAGGPALTFNGAPTVPLLYDRLLSNDLRTVPQERDQLQQGDFVQVRNSISLAERINLPPANQTITICKMTLRLVAFTPVADPGPNVLDVCSGVYMDPGGYQSEGCGGGFSADGVASFHLTSTQVGTSMTSAVTYDANTPAHVTATSEGGGAIRADIRVSTPGTYTFSVGLWQDTSGPTFDTQTLSQMILVGHLHDYWGGTECLNDLQQAQMPTPTDTPIALVCPGPAPL